MTDFVRGLSLGSGLAPELVVLVWSVGLVGLHILLQSGLATLELGSRWNAGPRDDGRKPQGVHAGRAERALRNLLETYPIFVGLALALVIAERSGLWFGVAGAVTWFAARLAYIPLYLLGVPYMRSLAWLVSLAGLGMMIVPLVLPPHHRLFY